MVLLFYELFNLLLTPLQLYHDLSVSLLDGLTVVTLSKAAVLKLLTTVLLCLVVFGELLIVERLHLAAAPLLSVFRILKVTIDFTHLIVSMRFQFVTQ